LRHAGKFGAEAAVDLVLLVTGIAIAYISWGYGFGSMARPGPGLYPFFVGTAIAVFAGVLVGARVKVAPGEERLDKTQRRTLAWMAAIFSLWVLAMPLLGYVLVTGLATLAFCRTMQLEGWRKPLGVAAGVSLFIYVMFDKWLYIDLPRGLLFGHAR
jgi:putative tricarboxylic transport membrane protein